MSPRAARLITGVVVAAAVGGALALCLSVPLTRLTDYLLAKERRRMSGTAVR